MSAGPWEPFRELSPSEIVARAVAARAKAAGPLARAGVGHMRIAVALRAYENNRYTVYWHETADPRPDGAGRVVRLSCLRRDGAPLHDWADLQRVKDEILGPEARAVEVYPPRSELVDDANLYHLWAWPTGVPCPFDLNLPPVTP